MNRPEDILQQAAAVYLGAVLPMDAFYTAVDKAGKRTAIQGARLKARGLKSGVPDILLWWRGIGYAIELKASAGQLTDSQRATLPAMQRAGVQVVVCRSIVEIHRALEVWAIPLEYHALDPATRDAMWQARLGQKPKRAAKPRQARPSKKALRVAGMGYRGNFW
jgi:hypothetical protein